MLLVAGNALGFFTGSGNVLPFSVDLSDFCRTFRKERNATIEIYKSHMFSSSMKCTTTSKETVFFKFGPQFDVRSFPGRKIKWIASFMGSLRKSTDLLYLYLASSKSKSYSLSTKVEYWNLIVGRYCWEISPAFGYVGSCKKRVAAVEDF